MSFFRILILIASLFIGLFRCDLLIKKGMNCIVLFDYSASLSDEEFNKYVEMFRQGLLKQLTFDDHIIIIPIDKASEMKDEVIADCNFSDFKEQLSRNIGPFEMLNEADTLNARFMRALDTMFSHEIYYFRDQRKKFNLETDIIGALIQAEKYLKESNNAIFIFSDMIQESPEVNFKKLNTSSEVEEKIKNLKDTAQMPNLKKSSIFVCGATEKNKQDYRLNKYFWEEFFKESKGYLKDYGYGNANRIASFINNIKAKQ
ncbi:MAG: hypothetical protein ACOY90_18560 [Candidatus Zhuqueibacterota bacterium]